MSVGRSWTSPSVQVVTRIWSEPVQVGTLPLLDHDHVALELPHDLVPVGAVLCGEPVQVETLPWLDPDLVRMGAAPQHASVPGIALVTSRW